MLMPSMLVRLVGITLTAILMTADWYVWAFRHRISRHGAAEFAHRRLADRKHVVHARSASGRELVATPAPQPAERNALYLEQVQDRSMDHCSQG